MLIALALTLAAAAPAAGGARLIDRVVAVVAPGGKAERRTVVTLSELELEARIALIRAGAAGAARAQIPRDTLAAALEHLIDEELIAAEAEDLAVVKVEPEEVNAQLAAFERAFPAPGDYRAFLEDNELSEPELMRILRRDVVVERYLASRARLAEKLEQKKREEMVSALVADLRSRAKVRVLFDPASDGGGP